MNAAEKRLHAAQAEVDKAKEALAHAQREVRDLAVQEGSVDQAIRVAIDEATRAGKAPSVDDARHHARSLADKRATAEQVVATLASVVREREEARDHQIAEDFPELVDGVARDAAKIHAGHAAALAAYEAATKPLEQAERELRTRWQALTAPLPAPLRPPLLDADLDPVMPTPNVGLGRYVAELYWPEWARQVVEASRNMDAAETERINIASVPMGV
jgi:hypothetical protein